MKKLIRRWRKGGAVLALGLSVAVLSGCEGLMDVELPAQLTDAVLTDPGNAGTLVNTFITHFESGWNSQAYENFGREAGGEVHLCGPCGVSDFQTPSPSFAAHSKSMRFARDLYEKLNKEWTVQQVPQRARYMALASLYQKRLITMETAVGASSNRDELQDMINRGVGVVPGAGVGRGAAPAGARLGQR